MAVRLLQGLLRRPTSKTAQVAADHGDGGPGRDFSMTESRTDAGAVCLMLSGDIDQVDHLLVDLDEVTFLDCSGIGALIAGYNAALAAGCRYEVRNPHGIVSTILRICGVDQLFPIEPTASPDAESFAA